MTSLVGTTSAAASSTFARATARPTPTAWPESSIHHSLGHEHLDLRRIRWAAELAEEVKGYLGPSNKVRPTASLGLWAPLPRTAEIDAYLRHYVSNRLDAGHASARMR